jgi:hypothetical protein
MPKHSQASSVWAEMPFMHGPESAEHAQVLRRALIANAESAAGRRQRVLEHDWAAQEICAVLGLSRADNWNGYVPPLYDSNGVLNTSPQRRGTVDILRRLDAAENAGSSEGVA